MVDQVVGYSSLAKELLQVVDCYVASVIILLMGDLLGFRLQLLGIFYGELEDGRPDHFVCALYVVLLAQGLHDFLVAHLLELFNKVILHLNVREREMKPKFMTV